AVAECLVDADPPGGAGGGLLAGDESIPQPPVDGGLVDAEELGCLGDAGHEVIVPDAADISGVGRDVVAATQAVDSFAGPGQPGGGAPVLAAQDPRDG